MARSVFATIRLKASKYNAVSGEVRTCDRWPRKGCGYKYLNETYNVRLNTVKSIKSGYNKKGSERRARGRGKKVLSQELIEQICGKANENGQRTLHQLCNILHDVCGIRVSTASVWNDLMDSVKRISVVPEKRNCAATTKLALNTQQSFLASTMRGAKFSSSMTAASGSTAE